MLRRSYSLGTRPPILILEKSTTHSLRTADVSSLRLPNVEWPLVGRKAELTRAVEAIESASGIALLGVAGVGKSRLLHELIDRLDASGATTLRGVATDLTRSVPFAPFASLLPSGPTQDPSDLFRHALESLREMGGGGSLVIALDDAHHLDEGSLALVATAVATEAAIVCLTARSGEPMDRHLTDLWTNGRVRRIDLDPLDRSETETLIKAALGEVEPALMDDLWSITEGNPLVLHELVEGAVGRAMAKDTDGVWRLNGTLTESPRLADLVRARTSQIPTGLRLGLELVSVGAPLPLDVLEMAASTSVSELEETGLISIDRLGDIAVAVPAHPLYGEATAANLGATTRREVYRKLVDAAVRSGGSVDDIQIAVWQREAGSNEHPEVTVRGAASALRRHDPALAEALVRPLLGHSAIAGVILGRALSYQHQYDQAEAILSTVDTDDPAVLGELASARAHNLAFGLGRVAEAMKVLEDAAGAVDDSTRAKLDSERGLVAAIRGDFTDAKAAGRRVLANPSSPPPARASAYVSLVLALTMTADIDGFEEIVDEAYQTARTAQAALPLAEDQVGIMQISAFLVAGRIKEAVALGRRFESRSAGSAILATWLNALVIAYDLAGQPRLGLDTALRARELMKVADPFHLEPQARGLAAFERGQLGDRAAMEEIEGIDFDLPDPRLSIWVDRGRVWAMVAAGATKEAAELAAARGTYAIEHQHRVWGAPALHDAVRLGHPELVTDDLAALRDSRGAHLNHVMADHAEALRAKDPDRLLAVATSFGRMGAPLLAAEAAAQAAALFEGEQGGVASCLSMGWERYCQDPRTPALAARSSLVSSRELDIALDAASGRTSSEISQKRYISVRTVDNHLRSVYRKLGLAGREELASVLAPLESND